MNSEGGGRPLVAHPEPRRHRKRMGRPVVVSNPPSHAIATDPLTDLIIHTAQQLHAFRQDHKQQQPTNLKAITTWNVGGWTQPGRAGDDKLRAIKAWLMRGPVALQETHWSEEQATKVTTLIPGARRCHSRHHQEHPPQRRSRSDPTNRI